MRLLAKATQVVTNIATIHCGCIFMMRRMMKNGFVNVHFNLDENITLIQKFNIRKG